MSNLPTVGTRVTTSMKPWALAAPWLVLAFPLLLANPVRAQLFEPNVPIPAAGGKGQIGGHEGYHPSVLGVADVFGNGPFDLFDRRGNIYPYKGFTDGGAPWYGAPVEFAGTVNGCLLAGPDGELLGLSRSGKRLRLLAFDKQARRFSPLAESPELDVPAALGNAVGRFDSKGKLHVFFTIPDSADYYGGDSHSHDYVPYNGAGFWRGGMPRHFLGYVRFGSAELKDVEQVKRYSQDRGEFLFGATDLTIVNLGQGRTTQLLASQKLGVLRLFGWNGADETLTADRFVNDERRVALRHPVINPGANALPDPKSGLSNLIVSDTGRIWFYPFTGQFAQTGSPVYGPPQPVVREGAHLALGALPVISPGDVDGDGLIDLIAGNDAGQLLFVRNVGSAKQPALADPIYPPCGGKPLDIKAGYRGSLQGPGEAMWGYTCPTLYDWNGDGRLDVVLNSITSEYRVLLQQNSRQRAAGSGQQANADAARSGRTEGPPVSSQPAGGRQGRTVAFSEPLPIYCEGLALNLSWRSQPAITDWGRPGQVCMIALDEENQLRCYWRIDDQNVRRGELLKLTGGEPILANDEGAGQTGRAKLVATDWDRDGNIDLLVGTSRGLRIPAGKGFGYPDVFGEQRKASVLLLRNAGTNAAPVFEYARLVQYNGERIKLGTHSCTPALVDLGRGVPDLLVGEERGAVRYYPAESLSLSEPGMR